MAAIPDPIDPTLAAIDAAMEARGNRPWRVPSLPLGSIGGNCERAIWYAFRWAAPSHFDAATLKKFEDGHHCEDVQAARLRMVDGIELWTVDPNTGKQFEAVFCDGNVRGRVDGVIAGILQAPRSPHVWEHKATDEAKLRKLEKLKRELVEKNALREWNPRYWATAQCYMRYFLIYRHYMTVSSPGGRRTVSVRTEYDHEAASALVKKADRIIKADRAPPRVSDKPDWYECKFCEFHAVCHQGELPQRNCRTCLHSTPATDGDWHCALTDGLADRDDQRAGCASHLYLPSLVGGEQTDAADDGSWVEYKMQDGSTWRNEAAK